MPRTPLLGALTTETGGAVGQRRAQVQVRGTAGDRIHTGESRGGASTPPRVPPRLPTGQRTCGRCARTGCGARQATRAAAAASPDDRGPGLRGWRGTAASARAAPGLHGADPAPPPPRGLRGAPQGTQTLTWLSWGGRRERGGSGQSQETTWRAAQQGRGFAWTLPIDPRPSSLAPVFPLLSTLTPPRRPGRPQQLRRTRPGPPKLRHFSSALQQYQISRRRHCWLRPQRRPAPSATASSRSPRPPGKAPLGSDRGTGQPSARAPQDTYAQLARRSPSRIVLTAIAARFRGKSGGCIPGRPPRRGSSCVPWDSRRPPLPRPPLPRTSGGP